MRKREEPCFLFYFGDLSALVSKSAVLFSVTLSLFKWTTPRVNYKLTAWPFIQMLQKLSLGYIECFLSSITATCAILVFESLQKRETFLFFNFRSPSFGILAKGTKEHCLFNMSLRCQRVQCFTLCMSRQCQLSEQLRFLCLFL